MKRFVACAGRYQYMYNEKLTRYIDDSGRDNRIGLYEDSSQILNEQEQFVHKTATR